MLNRLLDGGEQVFENGISAARYQSEANVPKATAIRPLSDLVATGTSSDSGRGDAVLAIR